MMCVWVCAYVRAYVRACVCVCIIIVLSFFEIWIVFGLRPGTN